MSSEAKGLLKNYLEARQTAGQTHVHLRAGVMDVLRYGRRPVAAKAQEVPRAVAEEPRLSATATRGLDEGRGQVAAPPPPARQAVATPVTPPEAPKRAALIEVTGATKAEKLAALEAIAEQSPEARELGTLRQTMVFAVGTPDAEIMFVGEAPGSEEERQREPFVGPAGQKLNGILTAMGLKREGIYISNICKFRPAMENQGFSNRAPTPLEMKTCLPYILTEISIIQPKVIVALGATASTGLGITGPVSKLRGSFYEVAGIPTMVTFHPSYILREEKLPGGGMQAKRQVWEDMLKVMEKAGLPINDKQRGYFRK